MQARNGGVSWLIYAVLKALRATITLIYAVLKALRATKRSPSSWVGMKTRTSKRRSAGAAAEGEGPGFWAAVQHWMLAGPGQKPA